jgi:predicted NAD/FAD-binding protein
MPKNKLYKDKSQKLKFAIIGSGVSGLVSAMLLSKKYQVTLYESNNYLGGHALTLKESILLGDKQKNIDFDVGFLVYNNKNYPYFKKLLKILKTPTITSNMSFCVSNKDNNFEYGSTGILAVTNNFKNILNKKFWLMFREIRRFYKTSNQLLKSNQNLDYTTNKFLIKYEFNQIFINEHFLPMCGAIWSIPFERVLNIPISTILIFFKNHGLLSFFGKPQWRTILGGSKNYIEAIKKEIKGNILLNEKVTNVKRYRNKVKVKSKSFEKIYDKIVFATHADDTLKLLDTPSEKEIKILSLCKYENNYIHVHQDKTLMPTNKKIWSAWNVITNKSYKRKICVTYWINKLQNIKSDQPILVTLNANKYKLPNSRKVIKSLTLRHPIINSNYVKAKKSIKNLQGQNNSYFTGAWLGYGFHEDGVKSAVDVAKKLKIKF